MPPRAVRPPDESALQRRGAPPLLLVGYQVRDCCSRASFGWWDFLPAALRLQWTHSGPRYFDRSLSSWPRCQLVPVMGCPQPGRQQVTGSPLLMRCCQRARSCW